MLYSTLGFNFEITAIIANLAFAAEVEQMFEDDFAHVLPMKDSDVDDKSFWLKLAIRLARLTSPGQ